MNDNDLMSVNCYYEGQRQEIQREMVLFDFNSVNEVYQKAKKVEQQLQVQRICHFGYPPDESSNRSEMLKIDIVSNISVTSTMF